MYRALEQLATQTGRADGDAGLGPGIFNEDVDPEVCRHTDPTTAGGHDIIADPGIQVEFVSKASGPMALGWLECIKRLVPPKNTCKKFDKKKCSALKQKGIHLVIQTTHPCPIYRSTTKELVEGQRDKALEREKQSLAHKEEVETWLNLHWRSSQQLVGLKGSSQQVISPTKKRLKLVQKKGSVVEPSLEKLTIIRRPQKKLTTNHRPKSRPPLKKLTMTRWP